MRDIKFRAWHKKRKIMSSVSEFYIDDVYFDHYYKNGEGKNDVKYEDIELMQFTGFLDKNGKEIYEGDIVKQKMPSGEQYFGEVVFEQGAFRITEKPTDDNPKIYNKDLIGGLAEVTGNKFENPELLK